MDLVVSTWRMHAMVVERIGAQVVCRGDRLCQIQCHSKEFNVIS